MVPSPRTEPDPRDPRDAAAVRFEAVFEAELDYVWTSLRRLGVHDRDIEDVSHEVFLHVHENLGRYDASRPIRPWLFAFAFRAAADYRRLARHRTDLYGDDEPVVASHTSAEDDLARRQREALVADALASLDIDKRAVFILHEIDETPMPEVATTLGIPLNTGYSRLRVAREEFAAAARRLVKSRGGLP